MILLIFVNISCHYFQIFFRLFRNYLKKLFNLVILYQLVLSMFFFINFAIIFLLIKETKKMESKNKINFTINKNTKIIDIINNPIFGNFGRYIFPIHKHISSSLTIENLYCLQCSLLLLNIIIDFLNQR